MKRILCMILAVSALFFLIGCTNEKIEDPVSFYYIRTKYTYGGADSVIVEETRNSEEYSSEYHLVKAYLEGPNDVSLDCPFSTATKLMNLHLEGDTVYITLSSHLIVLSKAKQTLAAVCLLKSLNDFSNINTIQIEVEAIPFGSVEPIIVSMDDIHLYDSLIEQIEIN